jgi:hypothetical protein
MKEVETGRNDFDLTIPDFERKRRRTGTETCPFVGCLQALKQVHLYTRDRVVFVKTERHDYSGLF